MNTNNTFSFSSIHPWFHNVQNAMDSVVHDMAQVAQGVAHHFQESTGGTARTSTSGFPHGQQTFHHQTTFDPSHQHTPPASDRAIRQLPTIRVDPEDLVDPNNRECCICLEENCLGDKVTRLPCAHIFHSECIVDWLGNHHCTCPVCRFELPTDNPQYEAGRQQRMRTRKPRFAMYELERMSIPQLLELLRQPVSGVMEKKELIQLLIDKERIDLIPSPEPVTYPLESLQAMRISELKRVMEDAGVFFHSKDVVEKSDMLTIFQNSGRLNLLTSTESNMDSNVFTDSQTSGSLELQSAKIPRKKPLVETVSEDSDVEDDNAPPVRDANAAPPQEMFAAAADSELTNRELITESTTSCEPPSSVDRSSYEASTVPPMNDSSESQSARLPQKKPIVETVSEDFDDEGNNVPTDPNANTAPPQEMFAAEAESELTNTEAMAESKTSCEPPYSVNWSSTEASAFPPWSPASRANTESTAVDSPEPMSIDGESSREGYPVVDNITMGSLPTSRTENHSQPLPVDRQKSLLDCECPAASLKASAKTPPPPARSEQQPEIPNYDNARGSSARFSEHSERPAPCPLQEYTIADLQELARESNIDLTSCFERSEMVNRLVNAGISEAREVDLLRSDFSDWSVSQLRALATETSIDVSQCTDREKLLDQILLEANHERPYLRNYLRVLSPLARASISQLRGTARDWRVDISDCLEKDEIILRLVGKAGEFGYC